jgi:hypothetical protein
MTVDFLKRQLAALRDFLYRFAELLASGIPAI